MKIGRNEPCPRGSGKKFKYARALTAFQHDCDSRHARRMLDKAARANPYVPGYLLGLNSFHEEVPLAIDIGDEAEAEVVASLELSAWQAIPGALGWLTQHLSPRLVLEELRCL